MYVIEDERHSEHVGQFSTLELALAELRRLAAIPWDQAPNQAPCTGWATCGRAYEVIEYDSTSESSRALRRIPALTISSRGVVWAPDVESQMPPSRA